MVAHIYSHKSDLKYVLVIEVEVWKDDFITDESFSEWNIPLKSLVNLLLTKQRPHHTAKIQKHNVHSVQIAKILSHTFYGKISWI